MPGKEITMKNKDIMREAEDNAAKVQELDLDDLDGVAGGYSLRDAKKEKTKAISEDTIRKI